MQSSRRTANRDRRWQLDDLSSPYVLRKALAGSGALTEINSTAIFFAVKIGKLIGFGPLHFEVPPTFISVYTLTGGP